MPAAKSPLMVSLRHHKRFRSMFEGWGGKQRTHAEKALLVPVSIPQRKGDPVVVSSDEGVRGDTTAESLGGLRPAFAKDGTITAATSSSIASASPTVRRRRWEEATSTSRVG